MQTRRNGMWEARVWLLQGSQGSLVGPVPQTPVTKTVAATPENCAPGPAREIVQEGHTHGHGRV